MLKVKQMFMKQKWKLFQDKWIKVAFRYGIENKKKRKKCY